MEAEKYENNLARQQETMATTTSSNSSSTTVSVPAAASTASTTGYGTAGGAEAWSEQNPWFMQPKDTKR